MNQPVIQILQAEGGHFRAITKLNPKQTAEILIDLAISFTRQDEREKILQKNNTSFLITSKTFSLDLVYLFYDFQFFHEM